MSSTTDRSDGNDSLMRTNLAPPCDRASSRREADTATGPVRDGAELLELDDPVPVVAQLEEHLLGVLGELGRHRREAPTACRRSRPATPPSRRGRRRRSGTDTKPPAARTTGRRRSRGAGAPAPTRRPRGRRSRPTRRAACVAKISLSSMTSSAELREAGHQGRVALVVEPLRSADGAEHVGPVPVALEPEHPEPLAVAGLVGADQRVRRLRRPSSASSARPSAAPC